VQAGRARDRANFSRRLNGSGAKSFDSRLPSLQQAHQIGRRRYLDRPKRQSLAYQVLRERDYRFERRTRVLTLEKVTSLGGIFTLSVTFCPAGCEYGSVRNQDTDVAPAVVGLRVFLSIPLCLSSEGMTPNSKASPAYGIRVRSVLPRVESYLDDR